MICDLIVLVFLTFFVDKLDDDEELFTIMYRPLLNKNKIKTSSKKHELTMIYLF